jgi:hypothetical protein
MNKINSLTGDANQSMTLKLEDGTFVNFTLSYFSSQDGWYYSLSYGNFSLSNRRLVVNPNLLRAYRNILPFGIACNTTDGYEPIFQNDFSSGRASFFLLNSSDVIAVEEYLNA